MSTLELVGSGAWLLPVAVAAGLDLYLALLVLGAAPLLGWPGAAAGPFAGLGTLPAVALAGLLYGTEILATRTAWASTAWNVANTLVRAVASGLLCLLAARAAGPLPPPLLAIAGATLTAAVHLARTGFWLEMDLEEVPGRIRLLGAAVEDVTAASLLYLALMRPAASLMLAAAVLLVGATRLRSYLSAGIAAHHLMLSAARGLLERGRWRDGRGAPDPVRGATGTGDGGADTLRWTSAAAWGSAVPGRFRRGWLVVDLGDTLFVGRGLGASSFMLDGAATSRTREHPLCTAVHLVLADGRPLGLAIPGTGPGPTALRQVFQGDTDPPGTPQ